MNDKVTYAEIIEALSKKSGVNKQKCERFTKSLIETVKTELKENGRASITNFGSFKVKELSERKGVNPQTGEEITIPSQNKVQFSPYKALRETVNAKYAHLESKLMDEDQVAAAAVADTKPAVPPKITKDAERTGQPLGSSTWIAFLFLVLIALAAAWFFMYEGTEQTTINERVETNITGQSTETADEAMTETEEAQTPVPTVEAEQDRQENVANEAIQQNERPIVTGGKRYTVLQNEWLWVIAYREYGEGYFWPLIFESSFNTGDNPDSLERDGELIIPSLDGTAGSLSQLDYQRLANAYRIVSEAYRNAGNTVKMDQYERMAVRWERNIDP